jgi:hypothetical protein
MSKRYLNVQGVADWYGINPAVVQAAVTPRLQKESQQRKKSPNNP